MAKKEDNLIPGGHKLTLEEQSNGGKASGKARRLKKTMKQALLELLEEEVKDKNGNKTGKTYQQLVNVGLLKGAIKGNAINYKTIAEMVGEIDPEDKTSTLILKMSKNDEAEYEKEMYDEFNRRNKQ